MLDHDIEAKTELKSGDLYWNALNPTRFEAPRLDCDLDCDVAVIGSGITGAFVARQLAMTGLDTVVVDRREIGQGSTPASTALIQYELDVTLIELAEQRGDRHADGAYIACHNAVGEIEKLSRQLGLSDRTRKRGSLYLAAESSDLPLLREETFRRQSCGIPCEFLDRQALITRCRVDRPCGIFSPQAIEVDPVALTTALHRASINAGVQYFARTDLAVETLGYDGVRLSSEHGPEIRAKKVIFASGYEIPSILKRKICTYRSTFALATEPIAPEKFWPGRSLVWEHADPYFYIRSTPDNRIVIGGEDIPESDPNVRDRQLRRKSAALLRKLHMLMPWLSVSSAYEWAGTFAVTDDGLPFVGSVPELPCCEFALGYGGNGITFGHLAAQIIRDNILDRINPMQHLFALDRDSTWTSSSSMIKPLLNLLPRPWWEIPRFTH
jgi:glycine/D-amino acid oxidase-like deaminating enzyme